MSKKYTKNQKKRIREARKKVPKSQRDASDFADQIENAKHWIDLLTPGEKDNLRKNWNHKTGEYRP